MSFSIAFTPPARRELIEAIDWYDGRSPGLGMALQAEVDRQIGRIAENPLQFPELVLDVRRARLRRFPFSLFFRLDEQTAFIVACFHASRNPRSWEG